MCRWMPQPSRLATLTSSAQQRLGIVDIGRMRSEPGDDAPVGRALALDEGGRLGEFLRAARLVAELDDAIGDDGAQPGLGRGAGDLLGEEILVAEGRGARQRHLGAGQRDGRRHVLGDHAQFRLADRVVPALHGEEALPLGMAAEQDHRANGYGH